LARLALLLLAFLRARMVRLRRLSCRSVCSCLAWLLQRAASIRRPSRRVGSWSKVWGLLVPNPSTRTSRLVNSGAVDRLAFFRIQKACGGEGCGATENRLHIYKRPCCTPAGADPDTNRSVGLHSIAVLGRRGRHAGLVEFTGCRSDLSMHLREHVFGGRLLVD